MKNGDLKSKNKININDYIPKEPINEKKISGRKHHNTYKNSVSGD